MMMDINKLSSRISGNPAASGWGIKNPNKGGKAVRSPLDAI